MPDYVDRAQNHPAHRPPNYRKDAQHRRAVVARSTCPLDGTLVHEGRCLDHRVRGCPVSHWESSSCADCLRGDLRHMWLLSWCYTLPAHQPTETAMNTTTNNTTNNTITHIADRRSEENTSELQYLMRNS